MPQALIDKMNKASTFNQGFATVEYLAAAIVDMTLHTDPSGVVDADASRRRRSPRSGCRRRSCSGTGSPLQPPLHVRRVLRGVLLLPLVRRDGRRRLAGLRRDRRPLAPPTAKKFMEIILATGDAIDRAEAYRQFRGRDPKVEALLANRGFPTK
jgi:peptidyl-dipeptidase Dcp